MGILLSSLQTGIQLACAILAVVALVAAVWTSSTYIGRPVGEFIQQRSRNFDNTRDNTQRGNNKQRNREEDEKDDVESNSESDSESVSGSSTRTRTRRSSSPSPSHTAGAVGFFLFWVAIMIEVSRFLNTKDGPVLGLNIIIAAEILLKAFVEGLVVLGVLSGAVKLVRRLSS